MSEHAAGREEIYQLTKASHLDTAVRDSALLPVVRLRGKNLKLLGNVGEA